MPSENMKLVQNDSNPIDEKNLKPKTTLRRNLY